MLRLLFQVHRWVGVALALFMTMWFASGLVIIYSGSPIQNRSQQLLHEEPLAPQSGWLSLGEAWERSAPARKALSAKLAHNNAAMNEGGEEKPGTVKPATEKPATAKTATAKPNKKPQQISEARLVRRDGEPVWVVEAGRNKRFAVSAVDGNLQTFSPEKAVKIAAGWLQKDGQAIAPLSYVETVDKAIILRNQESYRPFHRIAVADGSGTEIYVSARTGDVISASTTIGRGLYFVGNWLHLFRPIDLFAKGETRRTVLTWAGFTAFLGCLTGLIIGWLRWRPGWFNKQTYSQGRTQPYREFWFKWHFWVGLIGGTLALFWAFSGYIDNNPFKMFTENNNATPAELERYLGEQVPSAMRDWHPESLNQNQSDVVELIWRRLGKDATLLAYAPDAKRTPQQVSGAVQQFSDVTLLEGIGRIQKDAKVISTTVLNEYDSYYYPRRNRDPADRPLPVLKVELNDAGNSYLYLDAVDGKIILKNDKSRRVMRWIFPGLHYWDFRWLDHRPLWDAWIVTWILFGLVLSVSSIVIGWKRLVITFRPAKRKVGKPKTKPNSKLAPNLAQNLAKESMVKQSLAQEKQSLSTE